MSLERPCPRCERVLAAELFLPRADRPGQRDSLCRQCRAAYGREHYLANKQRYIDKAGDRKRVLREERTVFLLAYFKAHPCTDCGEPDPVVLEFDHVRAKRFDIGQALHSRSWQSILIEMEACEVVCANCHRRRTALRRGSMRFKLSST